MVIQLNGHDLPGTSCGPAPDHPQPYQNIHVGIGPRDAPVGLVPGDAPSAQWRVEVRVVPEPDGRYDFRGPFVQGKRGERFLYINWGEVDSEGRFRLFRRSKVLLGAIDPPLVREALAKGGELSCSFGLTDARGNPIVARLAPPRITWTAAATDR